MPFDRRRPPGIAVTIASCPIAAAVLLTAGALALGGCGIGKSVEQRINAAQPVAAEVLSAKAALDEAAKAQSLDARAIDADYEVRMTSRADLCAHDYRPSFIATTTHVHEALTDKTCFANADDALQRWLMWRRIGLLLAAPPLRPIPQLPPTVILASAPIEQAGFAKGAGVAIIQTAQHWEAIDLGNGATIAHGQADSIAPGSVSPNGRVFLARIGDDAQAIDTASGKTLGTIPRVDAAAIAWAGVAGVFYKPAWMPGRRDSQQLGPVFVDAVAGTQTPIAMASGAVSHAIALPGSDQRYALMAETRLAVVRLVSKGDHRVAVVLSEREAPPSTTWATSHADLTADGRLWFGATHHLNLLSLATLEAKDLPTDPLRLRDAIATPDPDHLLISGDFPDAPGQGIEFALFSLSQHTMARVDPARLLSPRVIYIAALRRNAAIEDKRIVLLDGLPSAAPLPVNDYLELREQAAVLREHPGMVHAVQPPAVSTVPAEPYTPPMSSFDKANK